jgi:hypothetical protein
MSAESCVEAGWPGSSEGEIKPQLCISAVLSLLEALQAVALGCEAHSLNSLSAK